LTPRGRENGCKTVSVSAVLAILPVQGGDVRPGLLSLGPGQATETVTLADYDLAVKGGDIAYGAAPVK